MKRNLILLMLLSITAGIYAQPEVGDKIAGFTATDQSGSSWTLEKALEKNDYLVVYFYPAAFTGGCTKQACAYRDQKGELEAAGAGIVGVSGDSPETLDLFALEHGLNFTLLADENGEIAKKFGVPARDGGSIERDIRGETRTLTRGTTITRWTFILDREGFLVYRDAEVDAAGDSSEVLKFLNSRE